MRWRCPPDRVVPRSPTAFETPLAGARQLGLRRPRRPRGARLRHSLRGGRNVCCRRWCRRKITDPAPPALICLRNSCGSRSATSMPSKVSVPCCLRKSATGAGTSWICPRRLAPPAPRLRPAGSQAKIVAPCAPGRRIAKRDVLDTTARAGSAASWGGQVQRSAVPSCIPSNVPRLAARATRPHLAERTDTAARKQRIEDELQEAARRSYAGDHIRAPTQSTRRCGERLITTLHHRAGARARCMSRRAFDHMRELCHARTFNG